MKSAWSDDDVAAFLARENAEHGDGPKGGTPVSTDEGLAAYGHVRSTALQRGAPKKRLLRTILVAIEQLLTRLSVGSRWKL